MTRLVDILEDSNASISSLTNWTGMGRACICFDVLYRILYIYLLGCFCFQVFDSCLADLDCLPESKGCVMSIDDEVTPLLSYISLGN